jgi:hypothetical protein
VFEVYYVAFAVLNLHVIGASVGLQVLCTLLVVLVQFVLLLLILDLLTASHDLVVVVH